MYNNDLFILHHIQLGSKNVFENAGFEPIKITRRRNCICSKILYINPFSDSKFG